MNLVNAKVAQLLIPVEDFDKALGFYRNILDVPFPFAAPPQMTFFNSRGVEFTDTDGNRLALMSEVTAA